MRRSTSRIGKLPEDVLEAVNEKLYTSWEHREIRKWLFEEVAVVDVPALGLVKGEKFGLVWLRSGKSMEHAWHHCELALGNWFRTWHGVWVRQKLLRSEPLRAVKRAKMLTQAAVAAEQDDASRPRSRDESQFQNRDSVGGGDVIMRSVLIDAISSVEEGGKDRREVAALANAWARLNQGKREEEKLKLKTEDAHQVALKLMSDELKGMPEAMAAFKNLCVVFDREKAAKAANSVARSR